jgi:hypothetical protein
LKITARNANDDNDDDDNDYRNYDDTPVTTSIQKINDRCNAIMHWETKPTIDPKKYKYNSQNDNDSEKEDNVHDVAKSGMSWVENKSYHRLKKKIGFDFAEE